MTSRYNAVTWQREGFIGILTLNRPQNMNALDLEIKEELLDLLKRLPDEPELRAVILTGSGSTFCAGGDLNKFLANSTEHQKRGGAVRLFSNHLARAFIGVEIPLIAAINGPAVGGGFTLALTCDIRIASEEARFGAVFARVGLSPEYGSSFLLVRAVGLTKASELILTARIFDSKEALDIDLITEVVPQNQLMERARALAQEIAALPPISVRMAKRTLRHGLESTLSQALDYEELCESYCFSSLDHQEAVRSFIEKRAPDFQGK